MKQLWFFVVKTEPFENIAVIKDDWEGGIFPPVFFFLFSVNNYTESQKMILKKIFNFYYRHFDDKSCLIFLSVCSKGTKIDFFTPLFSVPPSIFAKKSFLIISTVKIFQFDRKSETINDQSWSAHMTHNIYIVEVTVDFGKFDLNSQIPVITMCHMCAYTLKSFFERKNI